MFFYPFFDAIEIWHNRTELRVAPERHDASTLLEHSHHYHQYIQEHLLGQVPTNPAKVNLSTSCLFYFLYIIIDCPSQFEDVGSPVADEVMDEQVDTRRTKTEMTNQEIEYASYTLHTMHVQSEASMSTTFSDFLLLDRSTYYQVAAVWTLVEQQMYFDMAQLLRFTLPNASTFLHFKDTNFKC